MLGWLHLVAGGPPAATIEGPTRPELRSEGNLAYD